MRRYHLFEFEDQKWCPKPVRKGITDVLRFGITKFNIFQPVIPIIKKGLEKSSTKRIIDICSGSGGAILKINQQLKDSGCKDFKITLTEKYPNVREFKKTSSKSGGNIDYIETPVDATNIPKELEGFRTLFISFHHFREKEAKKILQDAADNKSVIGIFEVTERSFLQLLGVPMQFLSTFIFFDSFSFGRFLFTFIIPLIPIFYGWDCMVSTLRSYTTDELKQMTEEIKTEDYKWEIGKTSIKNKYGVTYLLGYPETTH